jgi:hypothetical protein
MVTEALRRYRQVTGDRGDEAIDAAEEVWIPYYPLTRDPVDTLGGDRGGAADIRCYG